VTPSGIVNETGRFVLPFPAVRDEVEALITDVIRPLMEADGGGVELVSVEGATVTLRLLRKCAGCPGAPYTRAGVIEPVLRRLLGSGVRVRLQRAPTQPRTPSAMKKPATPQQADDEP